MADENEPPPQENGGEDSEEELVISAADLLNLGDAPPLEQEDEGEGGEGVGEGSGGEGEGGKGKTLGASASVPVLGTNGDQRHSKVMFSADTQDGVGDLKDKEDMKKARHERRSVGKRSLTLGGRQKVSGKGRVPSWSSIKRH